MNFTSVFFSCSFLFSFSTDLAFHLSLVLFLGLFLCFLVVFYIFMFNFLVDCFVYRCLLLYYEATGVGASSEPWELIILCLGYLPHIVSPGSFTCLVLFPLGLRYLPRNVSPGSFTCPILFPPGSFTCPILFPLGLCYFPHIVSPGSFTCHKSFPLGLCYFPHIVSPGSFTCYKLFPLGLCYLPHTVFPWVFSFSPCPVKSKLNNQPSHLSGWFGTAQWLWCEENQPFLKSRKKKKDMELLLKWAQSSVKNSLDSCCPGAWRGAVWAGWLVPKRGWLP